MLSLLSVFMTTVSADPSTDYQTKGINSANNSLPVFWQELREKMEFRLGWKKNTKDFSTWKATGLAKARELMIWDPSTKPFDMVVLATEDRGSYIAQKIVFNISAESRVAAYLLLPKAAGSHPAALMLHDHGSRFDIGKEKFVRPIGDETRAKSSAEWATRFFSGRYPGDELATRGYVVLSFDALGWGDRSVSGYRTESQQALAANLFNLGSSYAAIIAQEDMRASEFLASLPQVDKTRIAAVGFSMGAFRAWQVCALSDAVSACIASCWMGTMQGLMTEGNNQLKGQSAFTMLHPGIGRYLDYPDIVGLAAPKSVLLYAGRKDTLFPATAVQDAFDTLKEIFGAAGAASRLETRFWDVPHSFDASMQDAAFAWLDAQFSRK